jgi:hypothetical protein
MNRFYFGERVKNNAVCEEINSRKRAKIWTTREFWLFRRVYTKKTRRSRHLNVLQVDGMVLADSIALDMSRLSGRGGGSNGGNLLVLEFKRVLLSAGGVGGLMDAAEGVGSGNTSMLQLHVDQGNDDDQPVGDVTDYRTDRSNVGPALKNICESDELKGFKY